MENKEDLNKMIDAIIKNKSEEAQIDFHKYLGDKMKVYFTPPTEDQKEHSNNDND